MQKYGLGLSNNSTAYDSNARSFLSGANPIPGWRGSPHSAICFSAQKDEVKTQIIRPPLPSAAFMQREEGWDPILFDS